MKYYWIRIFDYKRDEELKADTSDFTWGSFKGTMLDEYYLYGENMTREQVKEQASDRSGVQKFAKPRKGDGIYAIIMDSTKFYYERFCVEIDTKCFCCLKPIAGKMKDFPQMCHEQEKYYFCSHRCYREIYNKLHSPEGEFQKREDYTSNGGVFGYIYHIYNRKENTHYIGQTIYMPFFRWQEHTKSMLKGDICDLSFETIAEIRVKSQEYLNNIEAWWIQKYIHEYGRENVMNITIPKITIEYLVEEFNRKVLGQMKLDMLNKTGGKENE